MSRVSRVRQAPWSPVFFCEVLLIAGALINVLAGSVQADEQIEMDALIGSAGADLPSTESVDGAASENNAGEAELLPAAINLAQVTSVSELDDVLPTDWAYVALTRLVEDYGCLEGYPDSVFRGEQAITRYEFAAGLRSCLDVTTFLTDPADSDLETIQRLQEDFATELAAIRLRLDGLETTVATLEDNQFSTTTKLRGRVCSHLTGITTSGDIQAEGINVFAPARDANGDPVVRTITDDPEVTFSYLTWLNLLTSFTGEDRLILQLAVGDGTAPDRKSTRLNSSHLVISYAVFCLKKKMINRQNTSLKHCHLPIP